MVDIADFGSVRAKRSWPDGLASLKKLGPHAAFALCFAFTLALVLGLF